ncbi:MAG: type phosphodiesterase/nucleotide pyrophosphatase [Chloroflexi bacterium]|nr:type phosphodiesterase/nucleotide pyrophosphatase [Chloroflexota bacterium]
MAEAEPPRPLPRYGEAALADLVPALMHALGADEFPDPLGLDPLNSVALLVVDGLGFELLRERAASAPFLAGTALRAVPLTAGFPATTAASIASIGTGRPPGEHGLVGYTVWLPGEEGALNMLTWAPYGVRGGAGDTIHRLLPEEVQPDATAFERAVSSGIDVVLIGPRLHSHSGMTRAVLRGGRYRPAISLADTALQIVEALGERGRRFVYAYHPDLDAVGHLRGTASEAWTLQLADIDRTAALVAERLPAGSALVVTGDHGMIDLPPRSRVDVDDHPELSAGLRLLAGEARARHLHVRDGAVEDVLSAWRAHLGDRMWIVSRDQAIEEGWFGPIVPARIRARIGDVLAAAHGDVGVFQRSVDPAQARMMGHHGSMTAAEQLVPFVMVRR